jgi:hypothetical protein
MTLQEAQTQFSSIVDSISPALSAAALDAKTDALLALQQNLPSGSEFDVVSRAITEMITKLEGQITGTVLSDLQLTKAVVIEASNLLQKVATKADAEARLLTFEKPKLVLTALNEAASKLNEIRESVKRKDFQQVSVKADALMSLVQTTLQSIKTSQ